jgi:hypothetical protein
VASAFAKAPADRRSFSGGGQAEEKRLPLIFNASDFLPAEAGGHE